MCTQSLWWRGSGLASAIVVIALGIACARPHAVTQPEAPVLDAPAPPPRVIVPLEPEPLPAVPPPSAPAKTPARPRPRDVPARPEPTAPARPETGKPETQVPRPDPSTETPPAPAEMLQIVPPGTEEETERAIQTLLGRATADLNRVDYRALNADARTQYDTAKRFVQQATVALRERNLVFAARLADKAATMAAVLVGR
jgi:hypothetical protein